MSSKGKMKEVWDWLVAVYRLNPKDAVLRDAWGRAFDKCTDREMDAGKNAMENQYNSSFPPTTTIFLDYAGVVRSPISPSLTHNPSKYWTDDKGRFCADPTQKMKVACGVSTPEGERRAREKYFEKRRDFAGEFDTPLYKINKMLKGQGRRTFKSQQEWDAYKESVKTRVGHA